MANPDDTFTPAEMRQWLQREVREVMKAAELRIKDATDFVTGYATGEISAKQAAERMTQYDARWGEPIWGVSVEENMSNAEILRLRDQAASSPQKDWRKFFNEKKGRSR